MTVVAPKIEPDDPGPAGLRGVLSCAKSLVEWALLLPLVVPHEASHVVMSNVFSLRVTGGGVILGSTGTLRGVRLPYIHGFYVQHEPTDGWKSVLISLAPAFWFAPYVLLAESGLYWLALFCLLVAFTVISDVLSLAVRVLFDEDRVRPLAGGEDARYVYLIGQPDQWQTQLSRYE